MKVTAAESSSATMIRWRAKANAREAPMARFLVVDEDLNVKVTPWPHGPHRGA